MQIKLQKNPKSLRISKKRRTFARFFDGRWMNSLHTYIRTLSGEEIANTLTHAVPLIASLLLIHPLVRLSLAVDYYAVTGTILFMLGMVQMFGSSMLYHAATDRALKARLRILDHISIYVMIAGSYSLICLYVVRGWVGWTLFIFLWTCVLAGIAGKFIALGKYPRLSLILYLAMGWVALFILRPMWLNMPHAAFWWILAEGVFYTVGTYFFHFDEEHPYWHAIWHVFITLGAISHTIATILIIT